MTQKKNALFFLFDSLRYDVFSDMRRAQVLAPNLVKLIERGFLCPVISNGNATQFVMPSLFSLTYPLDYGGYSNGVVDRPKTFPELLREAGYDTHLTTTTYHLFPGHGYERGFNTTHAPLYYGGMVHTRIRNQVLHYLELEEAGEISRAELEDQVRVEITAIMDAVELAVRSADNGTWSRGLRRRNQQILAAAREERALVQKYPAAVIDKIANVPLKYLAKHLGRKRPTLLLPLMRVRDKIFKVARLFAVSRHFTLSGRQLPDSRGRRGARGSPPHGGVQKALVLALAPDGSSRLPECRTSDQRHESVAFLAEAPEGLDEGRALQAPFQLRTRHHVSRRPVGPAHRKDRRDG